MSSDATLGIICAILCGLACLAVFTHAAMLMPDRPNYPDAPKRLIEPLLIWGTVLGYRGAELFSSATSDHPGHVPPGMFMGSCMVAVIHAMLAEDTARKWLPARVQARLRHLWRLAGCEQRHKVRSERERQNRTPNARPGFVAGSTNPDITATALMELSRQGVRVIAPLEGPDAITEAVLNAGKP